MPDDSEIAFASRAISRTSSSTSRSTHTTRSQRDDAIRSSGRSCLGPASSGRRDSPSLALASHTAGPGRCSAEAGPIDEVITSTAASTSSHSLSSTASHKRPRSPLRSTTSTCIRYRRSILGFPNAVYSESNRRSSAFDHATKRLERQASRAVEGDKATVVVASAKSIRSRVLWAARCPPDHDDANFRGCKHRREAQQKAGVKHTDASAVNYDKYEKTKLLLAHHRDLP